MKSRMIHTAPKIVPVQPLMPPRDAGEVRDCYPARRTLLKCENTQMRPAAATQSSTNIVNNLRVINQIALRIHLHAGGVRVRGEFAPERMRTAAAFAGEAIDIALRNELERELALMRRGENIGSNRRRQVMLERYLLREPHQTIRYFYAARMRFAPSVSAVAERDDEGFQSDIIHERHTQATYTTYEQHNTQIFQQEGTPAQSQRADARQIAEQVLQRVERRMRLERERFGLLR